MFQDLLDYVIFLSNLSDFHYTAFKQQISTRFSGLSEDTYRLAFSYYESLKGR